MFMDEFDRLVSRAMRGWSFFDFATEDEDDAEKVEDPFEEMEKTFQKISRYHDDDAKSTGYSLGYHWETGMKDPEITITGDVDQKTVDNFINDLGKYFGTAALPQTSPQVKHLTEGENAKETIKYATPPSTTKESTIDHKVVELEMPGVGKDGIKVTFKEGKGVIIGDNGSLHYKRVIPLGFVSGEPTITADNGLIRVEFRRKETPKEPEQEKTSQTATPEPAPQEKVPQ